jgi:hypothetical protein
MNPNPNPNKALWEERRLHAHCGEHAESGEGARRGLGITAE